MFAAPSKDVQKKYTSVKNYGAALAPYVLALAMFVAIIIFNFAYPMKRKDDDDSTVISWLGGKILVGTLVAIAAALVEATLMLIVGLPVAHIFGYYAMTILFALSAMYLTQVLNLAFNRVGIFIALGLLTLSGSGGLFPAQTISPLYESTQKFLPMTYAINGYREAISGGIAGGTVVSSVFVLIVVALLSLLLMIPAVGLQSKWNHTSAND
ncbi:YhgE/Pip family protein [Lacticaseibacillus manihotivorans]|nr:YhgE/Pip family protein [Lacticaseibacillus manihotivorans]